MPARQHLQGLRKWVLHWPGETRAAAQRWPAPMVLEALIQLFSEKFPAFFLRCTFLGSSNVG
jgi:hypothetical protein